MRVLISGVTRSIGRLLAERLIADPAIDTVIGVDARPCYPPLQGLRFVRADVRRLEWAMWLDGMDVAVFLDALGWPLPRAYRAQDAALLDKSKRFLAEVAAAETPRLVIANSVALYGSSLKDQAAGVDESAPVRGHGASAYARVRAQMADYVSWFVPRHMPGRVTQMRIGWLSGARYPVAVSALGGGPVLACGREDRRVPVIHEEDALDAFQLVIKRDLPGIFNVADGAGLTFRELAVLLGGGQTCVSVGWLLARAWWSWRWRGRRTPPGWLRTLYWGGTLDSSALQAAGWTPRRTPRAAICDALDALRVE